MSEEPIPIKPLHERVSGRRRNAWTTASGGQRELLFAAVSPLPSRWKAVQGLENGSAGVAPLGVVHGFFAVTHLLGENWYGAAIHGLLTVVAILIYQAIVKTHRLWPALLLMAWLLFELTLANRLFGYRMGGSTLNMMGVPLAVLAIRAAWKMRSFKRSTGSEPSAT